MRLLLAHSSGGPGGRSRALGPIHQLQLMKPPLLSLAPREPAAGGEALKFYVTEKRWKVAGRVYPLTAVLTPGDFTCAGLLRSCLPSSMPYNLRSGVWSFQKRQKEAQELRVVGEATREERSPWGQETLSWSTEPSRNTPSGNHLYAQAPSQAASQPLQGIKGQHSLCCQVGDHLVKVMSVLPSVTALSLARDRSPELKLSLSQSTSASSHHTTLPLTNSDTCSL